MTNYDQPKTKLNQSGFTQGTASAGFWATFLLFIRYCHDVEMHSSDHAEARRRATSNDRKVRSSWEKEAHDANSREGRARFLAAETAWKLASIANSDAERELVTQLLKTTELTKTQWAHERARFEPFAVQSWSFGKQ